MNRPVYSGRRIRRSRHRASLEAAQRRPAGAGMDLHLHGPDVVGLVGTEEHEHVALGGCEEQPAAQQPDEEQAHHHDAEPHRQVSPGHAPISPRYSWRRLASIAPVTRATILACRSMKYVSGGAVTP